MDDRQGQKGGRRSRPGTGGPAAWVREYLDWRRGWIAGMSRSQRLRHRLFQGLVAVSAVIVALWLILGAWIRPPEIPTPQPPPAQSGEPGIEGPDEFEFAGAEIPDIVASGRREGVYTFLVVGKDTNSGLTDTMILVTYDTINQTLGGLNLPRDTIVNVSWSGKRLNTVYNYYKGREKETQVEKGTAALKQHVAKLTGILPDFYIVLEWDAVRELVDALGGVWFEVPYKMDYDDPYQDLHIHQEAGYRLLTGEDAMQVVRHRKNNDGSQSHGDVGRIKVQQDFLMTVAAECLKPRTILKAPALSKIFLENVDTDLTIGNLLAFAQMGMGMNAGQDVTFHTMPYRDFGFRGGAYVRPVESELLELVNEFFNPYLRDITASDLQLIYSKSNGTIGVTTGTLADAAAGVPLPPKAQEPEETAPESEGEPNPTPEEAPPETEPPEWLFPTPPATGGESEATGGESGQAVSVLPPVPQPVPAPAG